MSIEWGITRDGDTSYKLHNLGNETAEAVTILEDGLDGLGRQLPQGVTVPSGESVWFAVLKVDQMPNRTEVLVRWDGGGPEAVNLP